jgi:hypothetical protein
MLYTIEDATVPAPEWFAGQEPDTSAGGTHQKPFVKHGWMHGGVRCVRGPITAVDINFHKETTVLELKTELGWALGGSTKKERWAKVLPQLNKGFSEQFPAGASGEDELERAEVEKGFREIVESDSGVFSVPLDIDAVAQKVDGSVLTFVSPFRAFLPRVYQAFGHADEKQTNSTFRESQSSAPAATPPAAPAGGAERRRPGRQGPAPGCRFTVIFDVDDETPTGEVGVLVDQSDNQRKQACIFFGLFNNILTLLVLINARATSAKCTSYLKTGSRRQSSTRTFAEY